MTGPRRRFIGRIRMFNERRRQEFADAGFPLVPEDQLMVLEDYLDISRRRHSTMMPLFKLQLHMLQDLVTAEKGIRHYKSQLEELTGKSGQGAVGAANADELDEEASDDVEPSDDHDVESSASDIRAVRRELYFLRSEVRALRDIADGIAWRLFDYDRGALQELARRSTRQHVNPEGLLSELYTLASYFNERSGIAVLNDLTHFLKFGDVTVRRDSGEFEIVEVKAGTSGSGRLTRQRQGLEEVVSLLSNDQARAVSGSPVSITRVDITPELFVGNLRGLLDRARRNGAAVETIGSHLVLQCMDFMAIRERSLEKGQVFTTLERGDKVLDRWKAADEFVLSFDAQQRYAHVQNFAPISVFPLDAPACARLMSGTTALIAFVNISAVLRELEERGWRIEKSPFELARSEQMLEAIGRETPIVVLRKGRFTTSLPAALMGRLGMELLKPKSLVQLLDAMIEGGNERGYQFVNFAGESDMWR